MFIKRILGVIIILTVVLGLAVCVVAVVVGPPVLDRAAADIDGSMTSIAGTLDTVSETLRFAQDTSAQVSIGLNTAETSVLNTATILSQTRPLLSSTNEIVTVDIANSLDTVQTTIPTVAALAGNIDKTLAFLSQVNILGIKLGIDYKPDVPLDQSITAIGTSLNGIPEKLRSMSASMDATSQAIDTTAVNLTAIGSNLHDINANYSKLNSLFGTYMQNTTSLKQRVMAIQTALRNDLQYIKIGFYILIVWLALTHLAPLYVGFNLLTGHSATKA